MIDKNKIIETATKFVQKGQYDKAIKEYLKLIEADPKDSRILQKVGDLYQKKGEPERAADYFLKVGESYTSDGFFLKAVAVYKQVLKLDDTRIDVNLKLAELYQQLGLMSDAMAQLQIVSAHHESRGDALATLDLLKRMVELDPDNIASRIKLAELYARDNHNGEAVAEFQKAAGYLKRNNRVDDYIKVAERLVFLDPGNIELARELAQIYLAKQDTKRALAKLQVCFKADPRDVETLNLLAQAFQELGQISKTVSVYKELAKIYDEQDRVDEERAVWEKIRAVAPDDPEAEQHLAPPVAAQPAPASREARPPSGARHAAAALGPDQLAKLLTETDVYVKYGLHDKALEHLKRVFAADPDNIEGHDRAYALAKAAGQHARAEEELVTVVRLSIAAGDADRARARLHDLLETSPGHPEVAGFLDAVGQYGAGEEEVDDSILIDAEDAEVLVDDVGFGASAELSEDHPALDAAGADLADEALIDDQMLLSAGGDEELLAVGDDEALLAASDDDMALEVSNATVEDEALRVAGDGAAPAELDEALLSVSGDEPFFDVGQSEPAVSGTFELLTDDEALISADVDSPPELGEGLNEDLNQGPSDFAVEAAVDAEELDVAELQVEPYALDASDESVDDLVFADALDDQAPRPTAVYSPEQIASALEVDAQADDALFAVPDESDPDAELLDANEITGEQTSVGALPVQPLDPEPVAALGDEEDEGTQADAANATRVVNLADLARSDSWVTAAKVQAAPPADAVRTSMRLPAAPPAKPAPPVADLDPEPVDEAPEEDPAEDELDEAGFFIGQGDLETARDILETVLLAYPNHARARSSMAELEAAEAAAARAPASEPVADQSFDLAAELAEELGEAADDAEASPLQPGEDGFQISHEDVFAEFKKGVSKVVKPEDADTHYDLGIAYKEMGLTLDAVTEFEQAQAGSVGKPREVDCCASIAACRRELGDDEGAIDAYRAGLALPQAGPDATKAMLFEIATCFESLNEPNQALAYYQKVASLDPKYRDATGCVARLVDAGAVAAEDKGNKGGGSNGTPLNGKSGGGHGSNGSGPAGAAARPSSGGTKPSTRSKIGYV